jgi:hypothetical protein
MLFTEALSLVNEHQSASQRQFREAIPGRSCRSPLRRRVPFTLKDLLPRMRILTDPKMLVLLNAEAARRKQIAGRSCRVGGERRTLKVR